MLSRDPLGSLDSTEKVWEGKLHTPRRFPIGLIFVDPGTAYEFGTPEYDAILPPEKRPSGCRSVIVIDVHKVSTVRHPPTLAAAPVNSR